MSALADNYYIKALGCYPYELEEAIENLNYALSHDNQHCGSNYLMGKLYQEHFSNYELAEHYYQIAMASDSTNQHLCFDYISLFIVRREYSKAQKLIGYCQELKGIDQGRLYALQGLLVEYQHQFVEAISFYKKGILETFEEELMSQLKGDIKRVKEKKKMIAKEEKKNSGKSEND